MKQFWKNNSLSIVFFLLFVLALAGQSITGWKEYNNEREEHNQAIIPLSAYFITGHFLEATFENWESEFLQMALFVVLTVSLRQKGSSESKKIDETEEVDRLPDPTKNDAPWPVRKGGWVLKLYKHSLSITFFLLFLLSFVMHFYGSLKDYNHTQSIKGLPEKSASTYLADTKFWFESFENWQSEFLSVLCVVLLSIFLREYGSPQSKPVDAAHDETGE